MSDYVAIELLQDWDGRKVGHCFPLTPRGQARLLVRRGIARFVDELQQHKEQKPKQANASKPTRKRTRKSRGSKKTD